VQQRLVRRGRRSPDVVLRAPGPQLRLAPGPLALPATKHGTLLLRHAAALSLAQQVRLYDWLSTGCANLQVISLTTLPLWELVEDKGFVEGLYYRLNVIRLAPP
jgi:transcriptional regulator of acetoin/glycerol metabolism